MNAHTTNQPVHKAEAPQRALDEAARAEASRRAAAVNPRPEEDKYFDVPCTD